jgi:hypothetical protein
MEKVVQSRADYDAFLKKGINPLIDIDFVFDIYLRIDIQKELFGSSVVRANQKYYEYCWKHKPHFCEECGRPLTFYSATFISHILSRGANPEKAHDPRNSNILCAVHHAQWESPIKRVTMSIAAKNMFIIEMLKREYNVYTREPVKSYKTNEDRHETNLRCKRGKHSKQNRGTERNR